MTYQTMNFIPTLGWKMNNFFCMPTIDNILQNIIHVFTMHPLPSLAQRTCHHFGKIDASAN
jgi:hypothetical protein